MKFEVRNTFIHCGAQDEDEDDDIFDGAVKLKGGKQISEPVRIRPRHLDEIANRYRLTASSTRRCGLDSPLPASSSAQVCQGSVTPVRAGSGSGPQTDCRDASPEVVTELPSAATGAAGPMFAVPPEWAQTRKVLMRNIPNKYTQTMLVEEINAAGFEHRYDSLELPMDYNTYVNKGYAFVEFVNPSCAWLFSQTFNGCKMSHFNSSKIVAVVPARGRGAKERDALRTRPGRPHQTHCGGADQTQVMGGYSSALPPSYGGGTRVAQMQAMGPVADSRAAQVQAAGSVNLLGGKDPAPPLTADEAPWNFCPYCGAKSIPRARFCQNCGSTLALG